MSEEKKEQEWTFHSQHRNEEVWDAETNKPLCAFKDHKFTTKDPKLAKRLKELKYEEWVVFSEDDMIELEHGGGKIRLGDLPKAIREEWVGKPKRAAQDLLGLLNPFKGSGDSSEDPGEAQDEDPASGKFICPICKRDDFASQAALNGHFAHCKPEEKDDST